MPEDWNGERTLPDKMSPAPGDFLSVAEGTRDLLIINGEVFQPGCCVSQGLELGDVEAHFCGINEIAFSIESGRTRVYEIVGDRDLADFAFIHVAAYPRPTATLLSSIEVYLRHRGRQTLSVSGISAPTKIYQLMVLAQAGLPVPTTLYLPRHLLDRSFGEVAEKLGLPFVLKAMNASGGRLNFLIETEIDFLRYVDDPAFARAGFLAQQFVPNNGTFRTLVFGGDVPVVMHRCSTDGSHLSNTEQGGHATLFDAETFDAEAVQMAVRAAALLECEIAGVNLVQDRLTRQWYVLEVGSSPAIGSGAFAAEKTQAYSSYIRTKLSG
ncbi:ATP-grasp domain-containing protein [Streptomyces zaomyceticus]|uniref:ATP-grasp domain-containing protein n=1 Tax=Streptomyces zaomyceticus TaxID=68286 RepID=UPI003673EB11